MFPCLSPAAQVRRFGLAAGLMLLCGSAFAQSTATLEKTISEQSAADKSAQQAQAKIDSLDDQTRQAVAEYRAVIQESESLKRYNTQLEQMIASQATEMESMKSQLGEIETTAREIVPLLQRMLDTLDQFVKLDVPFLTEERAQRVQGLKNMMQRADVSVAEKYRRIVEAYQIEMEYGRTIEAYQGKIGDRTVEFLRVGRVALMYQSLDGGETGYWDVNTRDWKVDNDYRDAMRKGLKIAKKEGAPNLLIAPVAVAKENN